MSAQRVLIQQQMLDQQRKADADGNSPARTRVSYIQEGP